MKRLILFLCPLALLCGCEKNLPVSQADLIGTWVCTDETYTRGDGSLTVTFDEHSMTALNTTQCSPNLNNDGDTVGYTTCPSAFGGEVLTSPDGEITDGDSQYACYKLENEIIYKWFPADPDSCDCTEKHEGRRVSYHISSYNGEVLTLVVGDDHIFLDPVPDTYHFVKR